MNLCKSYNMFGYMATKEGDTLTIVVSEGDLLGFEDEIYYRYDPDDGLSLSFSSDSILDAIYLNGEIFSINLCEGSKAWEWMEQAEPGALKSLKSLTLLDTITEANIGSLEKLSKVNKNLVVINYSDNDTIDPYLLGLFAPDWHFAEILNQKNLSAQAESNLRELELIWFEEFDSSCLESLYDLPGLKSLVIEDWDSSEIVDFQFDKLPKLRSLTIIESDIHDLASLSALPRLKDLNLVACEDLEIGALAELMGLRDLGLTACESIPDIAIIQELPSLSRLSLPLDTKQEEFAGIISKQESLQVLEILCEDLSDLSPLEGYTGLKALSLSEKYPDLSPLYPMEDLDLLVLGETYYEDSLGLVALQNALPDTKIVQGGGLCMGSGWLLLLVPVIILLLISKTRNNKSRLVRTEQ